MDNEEKYSLLHANILYYTFIDGRGIFLRTACFHLRHHLMNKDEIRLCADILTEILILTHKQVAQISHINKVSYN